MQSFDQWDSGTHSLNVRGISLLSRSKPQAQIMPFITRIRQTQWSPILNQFSLLMLEVLVAKKRKVPLKMGHLDELTRALVLPLFFLGCYLRSCWSEQVKLWFAPAVLSPSFCLCKCQIAVTLTAQPWVCLSWSKALSVPGSSFPAKRWTGVQPNCHILKLVLIQFVSRHIYVCFRKPQSG